MFDESALRASIARAAAAALAAIILWPVALPAQKPALADVAKKEQERRKTTKDASKKLSNKDLPESALKPAPSAPADASRAEGQLPAAESSAGAQKPASEGEEKTEAWWRNRITQAREELRRNEMFLEALQSRINGLTTDFVSRDDPYQRAKIGEDRQKALAEMERVKAEIAANQKQIEGIEEEARKSGVPPGWLR
jgi:hypothetical protein